MFDITEESIKRNCYSNEVYERGLFYYASGKVKNIRVEDNFIKAWVMGTYDYNVEVEVLKDGRIGHASCECRAYDTYPGYCKHIVALLTYLRNKKQTILNMNDARISGNIINFFENKISPYIKQPVEIEINLEMLFTGMFGRKAQPAVSLRIGQKKLYVIKNIKSFIEQLKSKNAIEFGKCFTFDPKSCCIKDADMPIIDFIKEMYEIDRMSNIYTDYMHNNAMTMFKGKYLYLSAASFGRLINLLDGSTFNFIIKGMQYKNVRLLKKDIPIEFKLKKYDSNLMLNLDMPPDIRILTEDGKYVFYEGNIYSVSKSQRENLAPFYNMALDSGDNKFRFPEKDWGKFASIVIPNIKSAGKLTIDEDVKLMLYQKPLNAKVYLDKDGLKITVLINFIYGDYIMDPFNPGMKAKDKIVIRDIEAERKLLHIIEQSGFKLNKGQVYLDDDEKIYTFVTHYLPMIQKDYEVYYSEAFKEMRIYDSSHCRSSVKLNTGMDFLEFNFSIDGIDKSELPDIFSSLKRKKKYFRLNDGSYLPLDDSRLQTISQMLEHLGINDKDLNEDNIKVSKYKSIYLDENLKNIVPEFEKNERFKKMTADIKEYKYIDYAVPEKLDNVMRGYQKRGFKWLKTLSLYGFGGILADDMGLGKTLQSIALLLSEKYKNHLPSFVVCPTSLIFNWESEIKKFAPCISTVLITGSKPERKERFKDIKNVDLVVTSYPLLRRDIDWYRDIDFEYCILDEAQHIKNPDSQNARSAKKIKAKSYFALTGTPIENNLTELWSIFDFVMPGYLMPHSKFVERLEKPIMNNKDKSAMEELRLLVKPFILRRIKKDVLKELPPKIESVMTCKLTDEQKKVYLAYLQHIKGRIQDEVQEKGFERSRIQILSALTRLRQICCHPSLFLENYTGGSGKLDLLLEIIDELIDGGHRALIFSQFTGALKLIRGMLKDKDISSFYLDGAVKTPDRAAIVNRFNEGEKSVFLISLKAGGTGLNLTGADTVIHFDPWWNPAVEDQATDRAYRIGQENRVQVMKLITKGTIEDKIYKLQEKKKELIGSLLKPGETFISKMSREEIMALFE